MPNNQSQERKAAMAAYGAEIILVSQEAGMVGARDLAEQMVSQGRGFMLDQFSNPDNPESHYETTAPEIWNQSHQTITHFVSAMGTTGTIMGCSRFFREVNPDIAIIGVQPEDGSVIPGIRRWPTEYIPKIYQSERVDQIIDVSRDEAEDFTLRLAREEGIFCGISSGATFAAALKVAEKAERGSVILAMLPDTGERYLSTPLFENINEGNDEL